MTLVLATTYRDGCLLVVDGRQTLTGDVSRAAIQRPIRKMRFYGGHTLWAATGATTIQQSADEYLTNPDLPGTASGVISTAFSNARAEAVFRFSTIYGFRVDGMKVPDVPIGTAICASLDGGRPQVFAVDQNGTVTLESDGWMMAAGYAQELAYGLLYKVDFRSLDLKEASLQLYRAMRRVIDAEPLFIGPPIQMACVRMVDDEPQVMEFGDEQFAALDNAVDAWYQRDQEAARELADSLPEF